MATAAKVGQLLAIEETSFGASIADPATFWTGGTVKRMRVQGVDPSGLKKESEADPSMQQRITINPAQIMTTKRGSTFKHVMWLSGLGTGATGSVTSPNYGLLLKNAFGGESLGTGMTCTTGSTTTVLKVTSNSGLAIGQAIMVNGEARVITSLTPSTDITLNVALSTAPDNGAQIYGGATYYYDPTVLTDYSDSGYKSLALLFRGDAPFDQWQMRGCKANVKLTDLAAAKLPKVEFEFLVAGGWDAINTVSASSTALSDKDPAPAVNAGLFLTGAASTTRQQIHVSNFSADPGLAYGIVESASGAEGAVAIISPSAAPTGSFTAIWGSASPERFNDYNTDYENQTAKRILYQMGSTAGKTVLIDYPNARYSATPTRTEVNGLTAITVNFRGDESSTTTNALTRSPMRIHLL